MTSFGWKRKAGENVSKTVTSSFINDAKDENEEVNNGDVDWLTLIPNKRIHRLELEDNIGKSQRLKKEGTILAESERFWEAIRKWDEAISFRPEDKTVYEMKAQALMSLNELFPALTVAEKVVEIDPLWWVGYQTLGRAHLNLGEVKMAIKSFSKAIHLNPGEKELWKEDLRWACKLLTRKLDSKKDLEQQKNTLTITEIMETEDYFNQENEPPSTSQSIDNVKIVSESVKLSEQSIEYTNIDNDKTTIKHLPSNYVQMRDG